MSREAPSNAGHSHALAWSIAIPAVLLIYVLSIPFVVNLAMHFNAWDPKTRDQPAWLYGYCYPAMQFYLYARPLQKPMDAYGNWVSQSVFRQNP